MKTALVTGATDGIGKETALQLANLGFRVIVHGRSAAKVHAAAAAIAAASSAPAAEITADFTSLAQVRRMALEITRRFDQLDVLVNNAGTFCKERRLTAEGLEESFVVNHLSSFLLTELLLPFLQRSAPARVVNVSSIMHKRAPLDFDNLQGEKSFDPSGAYSVAKLGNIFATYDLAERCQGSGVTVNCLHPGVVSTKLLKAAFDMQGVTVQEGAATSVYLASSPEVERVSGQYFINKTAAASSPASQDTALRKRFCEISADLCKDYLEPLSQQ